MMRFTSKRYLFLLLGLLGVLVIQQAQAEHATETEVVPVLAVIPAMKDNTLYESSTGALSNGAGEYFFAGKTADGAIRRGVMAFDVAGSIPPNSTIQSVELVLHMSMTISGEQVMELHQLTTDWGEGLSNASGPEGAGTAAEIGDATWLHTFFDIYFWGTTGGNWQILPSATTSVNSIGFYTWDSTPKLVSDVQWDLDEPAKNYGWVLLGNEDAFSTAKRFDSRENSNVEFRPVLRVIYLPVSQNFLPLITNGVP